MRRASKATVLLALAAVMFLASGCLAGSSKTSGNSGGNSNTSKNISILVAFSGSQFTEFKNALLAVTKPQGINVTLASSSDFNTQIVLKAKSGPLPDIALFPQPGIMKQIEATGKLAPLDDVVNLSNLKQNMVAGITDAGTVDGKVYAIPPSINVKSLVFYPKQAWTTAGYQIPTTLAGLESLSAQIAASGKTPWCMGIESGTATGWPATDWMEQMVLDLDGPDVYNQWVNHTVAFNSPQITAAGNEFQKFFATPGWVNGGQKSIASDNFGTAGNAMFNTPPGCFMYKQGNFITEQGYFPSTVLAKTDQEIGVFEFPGTSATSKPVEGGGDMAGLFSGKNKYAKEVINDMLSPTFCQTCAQAGGYISPFKTFDMSKYPNDLTRQMAQIAYSATTFSFDASDQMPGAVGSGSFWTQMTSWVNGSTTLPAALKAIDATWPTS